MHWGAPDAKRSNACRVCGEPSPWRKDGPKGWGLHPACGWSHMDGADRDLLVRAIFTVSAALGATQIPAPPPPESTTPTQLGNAQAGCEICGRGYAALWLVAKTWRCAEHPPENNVYRRGRR